MNKTDIKLTELSQRCRQAADWIRELYFDNNFSFSEDEVKDEIRYLYTLYSKHANEKVVIYQNIANYAYHYFLSLDANGKISKWWDTCLREELKKLDNLDK